jgi:hypothetical protein
MHGERRSVVITVNVEVIEGRKRIGFEKMYTLFIMFSNCKGTFFCLLFSGCYLQGF